MKDLLEKLIGEQKVLLRILKIKGNAVHVGHLQQQPLINLIKSNIIDFQKLSISANNNLLIVQLLNLMEIMGVMVALELQLSIILKIMDKPRHQFILIKQSINNAKLGMENSELRE